MNKYPINNLNLIHFFEWSQPSPSFQLCILRHSKLSLKKRSLCTKHSTGHNLTLGLYGLDPEIQGPIHIRADNNVLTFGWHHIQKWGCISFKVFSLLELPWESCLIKFKGTISQWVKVIAYTGLWNSRMSINKGKDCQPVIDCEISSLLVFGGDGMWLVVMTPTYGLVFLFGSSPFHHYHCSRFRLLFVDSCLLTQTALLWLTLGHLS